MIIDQCQHAKLVEQRQRNEKLNREEELELIQLQHSERNSSKLQLKSSRGLFSTGMLSHDLALISTYQHRHADESEATTFQDEWVTVDYIFYRYLC